jgi:hypothetical protein
MEIHASFESDGKNPLYEDENSVLLMDRLPQGGIGSVFIRTFEIGQEDPPIAFLMLSDAEIDELKEWDDEPALQKAIEKIIEYAAANPKEEYLFMLLD